MRASENYLLNRFFERLTNSPLLEDLDTEDPEIMRQLAGLCEGLYEEAEGLDLRTHKPRSGEVSR